MGTRHRSQVLVVLAAGVLMLSAADAAAGADGATCYPVPREGCPEEGSVALPPAPAPPVEEVEPPAPPAEEVEPPAPPEEEVAPPAPPAEKPEPPGAPVEPPGSQPLPPAPPVTVTTEPLAQTGTSLELLLALVIACGIAGGLALRFGRRPGEPAGGRPGRRGPDAT